MKGGITSVFIAEPNGSGWIIRHLMLDIAAEVQRRGIEVSIGDVSKYRGEEVIFNARYLTPFQDPRARVNALLITHVDDRLREIELRRSMPQFNSLICMSHHDAKFVAGLKGDGSGVIGIDIPARRTAIRPVRLALFSAFYADGRKNESWITDYFRTRPADHRQSFVFSFLGEGWERFASEMATLDLSFELIRYRRDLPVEYDIYREALSRSNILIYMGFDGGAMSVYDAIDLGLDVIVSDASYHRDLGETVQLVKDREDFFAALDRLHAAVRSRRDTLANRAINRYVDQLLAHWQAVIDGSATQESTIDSEVVHEFRSHYKRLGYSRLRSAFIRLLQRRRWLPWT